MIDRFILRLATGFVSLMLASAVYAAEFEEAVTAKPSPEQTVYSVTFDAKLVPSEKSAEVEIRLGADASPVKSMLLRHEPARHQAFRADGKLEETAEGWVWTPPPGGGALRYSFSIDHLRDEGAYDSRSAKRWALFRGEDLVPTIRIRTHVGATSRSRLRFQLPEGWSAVTPYRRTVSGEFQVSDPRSRFDRPAGWILIGEIGVLREKFGDTHVTIAGPNDHAVRRNDMMALLHWTMPSLQEVFGRLPPRLLLVSASDPMWRGGLSGTNSVFLHADRPLIDRDITSPILHELVHTLMRARAGKGGDWIVEGLAEFYSLEVLHRSGTLSDERYHSGWAKQEQKAKGAGKLRVKKVRPATRARAMLILRELDAEIRRATDDTKSLDDVVRLLVEDKRAIVTSRFRELCEQVAGESVGRVLDPHIGSAKREG